MEGDYYLRIEMFADFDMAKEILTKAQYVIYKIRVNILLKQFYRGIPADYKEDTKNGFINESYGTKEVVEEEYKKMLNFMHCDKCPDEYTKVMNDSFLNKIRRKFKGFKTSLFDKAIKDSSVIGKLNSFGLMVNITKGKRNPKQLQSS